MGLQKITNIQWYEYSFDGLEVRQKKVKITTNSYYEIK